MGPIDVLAISTVVYAVLLTITYIVMLKKSPPGYREPKLKEVLVIAIAAMSFFTLGYLLIYAVLQLK